MADLTVTSQFSKIFFTFALINITLLIIYFYCRYKLNYWKRRGVQQLRSRNLIFGDFKDGILFRTAPGYHLCKIYDEAPQDAPLVGFYIFHKPCILLKDPEIIKHIMIRDFDNFSDRHFAGISQFDSIGMRNLFGIRNPMWRYLRSKIAPTLSKSKLKQMIPLMLETGKPMIEYLQEQPVDDRGVKVVDAQDLNFKYTADLIANYALGIKTDSFKHPDSDYSKFLMDFFKSFKRMVALFTVFFIPELVSNLGSLMLFDSTYLRQVFWDSVEYREKNNIKRGDYIDSIIDLKNGEQNSIYKFEGDNLIHQSGMFFSGLESSSGVAAYALWELARNKEYQDKAREDIKKSVEKHGWTFDALMNMQYLDQCVSEAIRLHPPITTIDRTTAQDYKVPNTDITIKKGTPIYISVYSLNVDPQYFDEPEVFSPDRFTEKKIKSGVYIPFGIGPRICVGPMVYGVAYCPVSKKEILKNLGCDDSKALTEEKRDEIFLKMLSEQESVGNVGWAAEIISPNYISNSMYKRAKHSLNEVSMNSAIDLIKRCADSGANITEVYVDTVGPPEKYQARLSEIFPDYKITVAKKADSIYPIVSAASIVAKVTRDHALKVWRFREGLDMDHSEFGSGYPGDPLTKKFIREQIDNVFGYPILVRFSWSTAELMLQEKAATCTFEEVDDPTTTKKSRAAAGTKSISTFFAPKLENGETKKRKRHKFFEERFLTMNDAFE